jgi:hypothetical protein
MPACGDGSLHGYDSDHMKPSMWILEETEGRFIFDAGKYHSDIIELYVLPENGFLQYKHS